jgi:peptide/nickel transport system ATP-binding protein
MRPALLIADEPTTALDLTIQAQILTLLATLQAQLAMSVLLITHDLGVIAERAQRVLVMYAGQIVEEAPVRTLFDAPRHPYTVGLLAAMPRLGAHRERLAVIPGAVPSATNWPAGCRFRERCPHAFDRCTTEAPPLYEIDATHRSRCHLAETP